MSTLTHVENTGAVEVVEVKVCNEKIAIQNIFDWANWTCLGIVLCVCCILATNQIYFEKAKLITC